MSFRHAVRYDTFAARHVQYQINRRALANIDQRDRQINILNITPFRLFAVIKIKRRRE